MPRMKHATHMPISRLLWMAGAHFALMYLLMYAMVYQISNVIPNFNQAYMAALMTAPMLILEGLLMGQMYEPRSVRWLLAVAILVFVAAFALIRGQVGVGDRELLRSMIPHHAGAILMCTQADLRDVEVQDLCDRILESQQAEIKEMKLLLAQ
jgi:uncharacterized protein (DUF305 family)